MGQGTPPLGGSVLRGREEARDKKKKLKQCVNPTYIQSVSNPTSNQSIKSTHITPPPLYVIPKKKLKILGPSMRYQVVNIG